MEKLLIEGGAPLAGSVGISGSKNSSLPILAATLLTDEPCVIRRVPDVSDTHYMLGILRAMGAAVDRASGTVTVQAATLTSSEAPYDLVRKMRASVCVLGPLIARLRKATVSLPGGCVIGDRPIDLHLRGFEKLGAGIRVEGGNVIVEAPELTGREVNLRGKHGSTVLGTDNIMMAATLAEGTTIIDGAAAEPEVVDLAEFLIKMGAKIEGAGTPRIVIHGVKKLGGADHTVIADRIEAGTFLVIGALAGRREGIVLKRTRPDHLECVIGVLRRCGHEIEISGDEMRVRPGTTSRGSNIETESYPGFPTDMQAQMAALFCLTPGISVITETIFPQRFMYAAELNRMGADIRLEGSTAVVQGVERLSGAPVMASDLRASAALVLAALRAEGKTEINRVYHIDRGYEMLDEKLMNLGARIERCQA
ncbi:MAG: UDP-N-acetylglucosamine 1-carboxyvinyltransferase [Verrucomicrobia bacterium]|nr:UDP-N-acetylglucosamine 1-carboxyvinyltransferase [Verrucomicrobiota bacterium]